jgi:hypothetical protein
LDLYEICASRIAEEFSWCVGQAGGFRILCRLISNGYRLVVSGLRRRKEHADAVSDDGTLPAEDLLSIYCLVRAIAVFDPPYPYRRTDVDPLTSRIRSHEFLPDRVEQLPAIS